MEIDKTSDENKKTSSDGPPKNNKKIKVMEIANITDNYGNTLLHDLAKNGRKELIAETISFGCNVNAKNHCELTPLAVAVFYRNMEIAKLLLDAGATHENLCFDSIKLRDDLYFKGLLKLNNKNDQLKNDSKFSLLHLAVIAGSKCPNNFEFIEALVKSGQSIEARTLKKRTPLHFACIISDEKMVKFLLKMGANLHAEDDTKMTPFLWAADKNCLKLMKLFLDLGVDINHSNAKGINAMLFAAKAHNANIINFLLERNAKIDVRESRSRFDPFLCCLLLGQDEGTHSVNNYGPYDIDNEIKCLEIFLDHGVRIDFSREYERTLCEYVPVLYEALEIKEVEPEIIDIIYMNGGLAHLDCRNEMAPQHINEQLVKHVALVDALNKEYRRPRNFELESLSPSLRSYYAKCRDELESMKTPCWSQGSITYLDIFDDKRSTTYARDKTLKCAFIKKRFPIYQTLLIKRFSKIKLREELVSSAELKFMPILVRYNAMVPEILEKIFSYLDNYDLRKIMKL